MRIWSIHPKYLDAKGLVALWREALLAKHVLEGKTKGYKNHPQLNRFKSCNRPIDAIDNYLTTVHKEATRRQYNFDKHKINWNFSPISLSVTKGQIEFEATHLLNKLRTRNPKKHQDLNHIPVFDPHPIFNLIDGDIEDWEIMTIP